MKQKLSELDLFTKDVSNFFTESDNGFQILHYLVNFLFATFNGYRHETPSSLICTINTFSITFLNLDNQQHKSSSDSLHLQLCIV